MPTMIMTVEQWFLSMRGRLDQIVSLWQSQPFDTSSPEGRSKERYRRILFTVLGNAASKGIALLSILITVPLTVNYLGAERYGLWMTISSLVSFLNFADLGVSNGLLTAVSAATGYDDHGLAREFISSAFLVLFVVVAFLGTLFALIYSWMPWSRVFNVSSPLAVAEAGPSVAVFIFCFLLNILLGVVQQTQMGYQEGFANSMWQGGGKLLGMVGVLVAVYLRASLPWIVLAVMGLPLISTILNGLVLFGFKHPELRPSLRYIGAATVKRVLGTSLLFFVLQLAGAFAYQSPNIIITQLLGASQVPQYAVPLQLFLVPNTILSLFLNPLWPAYGEAIARRDMKWVRKTLSRSILLGFAINTPAALFLIFFGRQVVHFWVGPVVTPSFWLLLGLGLWIMFGSLGGPLAMLLNGANVIGLQVICSLAMGISSFLLSVLLVKSFGVPGVIYGILIAQTVFIFIPYVVYLPRLFARWSKQLS